MPPKPERGVSGRFVKPKGPSQGQIKGPSQGQTKGPSQGHPDGVASASEARRAPSAASLFCRADESDTDESTGFASDVSTMSVDRQQTRKRAFLKEKSGDSTSDSSKKSPKRKIKAKPAESVGPVVADSHDVGLADAQHQLNLLRRAQLQEDLQEKVSAKETQARTTRAKSGYGASSVIYTDFSMAELERTAQEDEEEITEIVSKSSNLKGTFQKALKCRAASMRGVIRELLQRTATDETRQLQAKVDRLQSEVSQLHKKLAEVTAQPAPVSQRPAAEKALNSNSDLEEIIRKVVTEERAFTRACFAGIEDRLLPEKRLRPPLAVDKRQHEREPSSSQREPEPGPSTRREPEPMREDALLPATTPSNQSWAQVVKKGKGKPKKTVAAPTATLSCPPQTTGKGKGEGKGKKSPPKPSSAAPAAKEALAGARKRLSPPKSAAVVVTLTAEAAEKGETYMSVLKRARTNADPAQLGIEKVACRRTQTGARIFEFSGAQGNANADLFASKLQEVIADSAKVVRPVKMATLEVTDLDDSVTKEEVEAAVAKIGGCDAAAVKGRDIRPGRGGMGTIRLECPVAAAEAVLAKGRLLIGFSSSVVRALADQPLRCYKCFAIGHTRALCPSSVDRSDWCYRCGKEGHKLASCKAVTPLCAVCAASGCPAGHIMKGGNCNPPPKKGKAQAAARPVASTATPGAGSSVADEAGAMSE